MSGPMPSRQQKQKSSRSPPSLKSPQQSTQISSKLRDICTFWHLFGFPQMFDTSSGLQLDLTKFLQLPNLLLLVSFSIKQNSWLPLEQKSYYQILPRGLHKKRGVAQELLTENHLLWISSIFPPGQITCLNIMQEADVTHVTSHILATFAHISFKCKNQGIKATLVSDLSVRKSCKHWSSRRRSVWGVSARTHQLSCFYPSGPRLIWGESHL